MTLELPIAGLITTLIDYRGKTPTKTTSGVPLITAKVIKDGRILREPREYIAEDAYDLWMRRGLPATGDILVTTEAPLGQVAQVPDDARVALAQRVILLRADPSKVDPQFLFHFLRSPLARERLEQRSSGTTVSGIRQPELRAVLVPLLERRAQETVGQILDCLDDLIENNRRRVEILEEMARAVYREWLINFRYPGHESANLINSPAGPIPEGWRAGVVGDLVNLITATTTPDAVDPDTPAVGLEHIPRQHLTLCEWGRAAGLGSRKALFSSGDVLFGKIRPYFHKVSVAPMDGICSTDALVLRPHDDHWGQAVMALSSGDFIANATQTANGTKMPRADWKVIRRFPAVIADVTTARRYTATARTALSLAQKLMFQSRELTSLRDLLLPKLVSGQIDVASLRLDLMVGSTAA